MANNKKLAFDIDGVVFPYLEYFRRVASDKYNLNNLPDPEYFSLMKSWGGLGLTPEVRLKVYYALFDADKAEHDNWEPYKGSVEALTELNRLGYEIYFLTARTDLENSKHSDKYEIIVHSTSAWIEKYFPFTKQVLYFKDKAQHAHDFLCLLEDRGRICLEWQEAGGQAIMYARAWNARYRTGGFQVFNGWSEDDLLSHIKTIEAKQ